MKKMIAVNLITIIVIVLFSLLGSFNAVAQESGSSVFVFKENNDLAITVAEFGSKSEQGQIKIIKGLMWRGLEQLSSNLDNGVQKSEEKIQRDRRMSNLIRAYFTRQKINDLEFLEIDPDKIIKFLDEANFAFDESPNLPIWEIFVSYAQREYERFYTKSAEDWKRNFNSWTDEQQEMYFSTELNKSIAKIDKKTTQRLAEMNREIAELDKKIKEENKKIEESEKITKKLKEDNVVIDKVLTKIRVEELKISFRRSKTNSKKLVLILKNESEGAVSFDLKCSISNKQARTLSVSIAANKIKELGFIKGKGSDFVLGERCEIYNGSERLRSFTVLTETNSDKILSGTTWTGEDNNFFLYDLIFAEETVRLTLTDVDEEAPIEQKGKYRKVGNTVYMDFPSVSIESTIKGNEMEVSLTYKKDNSKERWTAKKAQK